MAHVYQGPHSASHNSDMTAKQMDDCCCVFLVHHELGWGWGLRHSVPGADGQERADCLDRNGRARLRKTIVHCAPLSVSPSTRQLANSAAVSMPLHTCAAVRCNWTTTTTTSRDMHTYGPPAPGAPYAPRMRVQAPGIHGAPRDRPTKRVKRHGKDERACRVRDSV